MLEAEEAERCASCAMVPCNNVGQDFSLSSALLASLLSLNVLLWDYIMLIKVDYFMNQSSSLRNKGILPNPFPTGWQFCAFRLILFVFCLSVLRETLACVWSMHSWTVFGHEYLPKMLTSSLKEVSRPLKYCCGLNCVPPKDVQVLTPSTGVSKWPYLEM